MPTTEVWPPIAVAWHGTVKGKQVRGFIDLEPVWMRDGLAVTPALDLADHWTVTHARSGWAVIRGFKSSQDAAIEVAKRLLAFGDWRRSRTKLLADRPFIQQCRELREQLRQEGVIS